MPAKKVAKKKPAPRPAPAKKPAQSKKRAAARKSERKRKSPAPALFKLVARFERAGSGKPVTGERYRVRFYDRDPLRDDFLGESTLSRTGAAEVVCSTLDFKGFDSPFEKHPDVYCVLLNDGREVFRTPVANDLPVGEPDPVTLVPRTTFDLGVFRV